MGPWTFTNAGATGRFGPTQSQINTSYAGTSLEGSVTINETHQGIQEWMVPATGTYRIEAWGSQGGNEKINQGGLGAKVSGNFEFDFGSTLKILIGQRTEELPGEPNDPYRRGAGGGGGSFIEFNGILLIAAGGGGGAGEEVLEGINGSILQTAQNGGDGTGLGGANGDGGTQGISHGGAGGAGWNNDGANGNQSHGSNGFPQNTGGLKFQNGGLGGTKLYFSASNFGTEGGFGGGGGAWASSGGGGGFSGGGGGGYNGSARYQGGGGGSYNSGTNQDNQAGVNEGHGKVIITYIGN
jgi:hypothetical protein